MCQANPSATCVTVDLKAIAAEAKGYVEKFGLASRIKPGGRLFVLDMMTDATHTAPKFSALFAVNMALTTENGWVFSDEELKGWMREAGFTPGETRPVPPPMPHWLVEAVK